MVCAPVWVKGFLSFIQTTIWFSDNKLRREAAVAMGVTCTGESFPVVPRRQGGSVGLWTLWHCLHCLEGVCVWVRVAKQSSFSLFLFFFSRQTWFFCLRTREKIREKLNNAACFHYGCSCFCKSVLVVFRQDKIRADHCSSISCFFRVQLKWLYNSHHW